MKGKDLLLPFYVALCQSLSIINIYQVAFMVKG